MIKNISIPGIIFDQLNNNKPVVLLTIVDILGSSPRHAGTKMVVNADGDAYGTIGGSVFEAKAIQQAKQVLKKGKSEFLEFELNEKSTDGMVCGGKALVFLDYIDACTSNTQLFKNWQESLDKGKGFYYLVQIKGKSSSLRIAGRSLLIHDGIFSSDIKLSKKQLDTLRNEVQNVPSTTIVSLDNSRFVVDPIKRLQTLYLIGAGHVASPTAQIAAMVGFQVVVLDDRADFANKQRFPDAEQIEIIKDYKRVFREFDLDDDSCVVIMTRGHAYDRVALEQALKTTAGYIGMISSRQKRESVYRTLLTKGATRQQLARVHSPIGIDIGSETPEEIAVSIVAELIKVRSGLEA